jgi:mRNA-degrading endonuclease RelE of RelBE toxin-antitoxin system
MSFEVITTPNFDREAKRLAKKYPSLKHDLAQLFTELTTDPSKGIPLGKDVYKIRLSIASKGKGRSGGARVITCVRWTGETIYPFSIYDKGDKDSVSDKELKLLLKDVPKSDEGKG